MLTNYVAAFLNEKTQLENYIIIKNGILNNKGMLINCIASHNQKLNF